MNYRVTNLSYIGERKIPEMRLVGVSVVSSGARTRFRARSC